MTSHTWRLFVSPRKETLAASHPTYPHSELVDILDDVSGFNTSSLRRLQSILATMSESPPRVRRAARTYGRRQATSDVDTSFEAANTSVETREDSDLSMSTSSYGDPPPDSDDRDAHNASPTSRHGSDASDDEDGNTPAFEFSWKAKLRAIDAGELENIALAGEDETRSASGQITRPTTPNRAASTAFDGSLSSLTASSPPVSQENRPKRPEDLPISDPESDHPKSSPRHPMNTPKSGSSPTPPTSIEAPPMKGKGKQRNVTPLQFSGDEQLPTAPKPSNARRTKQAKGKEVAKRVKVSNISVGSHSV